jgi:hypothetical protein
MFLPLRHCARLFFMSAGIAINTQFQIFIRACFGTAS